MGLRAINIDAGAGLHPANRAAAAASTQSLTDAELLDRELDRLAATDSGAELAAYLRTHRGSVSVLDAEAAARELPAGAGGAWSPVTRKLMIARDQLEHPAGVTLLAHEAQHMQDDDSLLKTYGSRLYGVVRSTLDMAVAPLQGRNPISAAIDGVHSHVLIRHEVSAYHLQARVAQDLSLRSEQLHNPDGSPRSKEEIAGWLGTDPLYKLADWQRLAIGSGFTLLGARLTSQLAKAGIAKVAPTSFLGRHPLATVGIVSAAWGALLLHDAWQHRS